MRSTQKSQNNVKTFIGLLIGFLGAGMLLMVPVIGLIFVLIGAIVLYQDWLDIVELKLPTQRDT